jgi:hypothetical protein
MRAIAMIIAVMMAASIAAGCQSNTASDLDNSRRCSDPGSTCELPRRAGQDNGTGANF